VENPVPFGTGIDGCSVMGGGTSAIDGLSLGNDFQSGQVCRIPVMFPAYQARYPVSFFHAGVLKDPMIRPADDPVCRSVERIDGSGSDQRIFIGPGVRFEGTHDAQRLLVLPEAS